MRAQRMSKEDRGHKADDEDCGCEIKRCLNQGGHPLIINECPLWFCGSNTYPPPPASRAHQRGAGSGPALAGNPRPGATSLSSACASLRRLQPSSTETIHSRPRALRVRASSTDRNASRSGTELKRETSWGP